MSNKKTDSKIIVALDGLDAKGMYDLIESIRYMDDKPILKIGLEMFAKEGMTSVKALTNAGFKIFLDLKLYDIPATISKTIEIISDSGVWMTNIHCSGSLRMMDAASKANKTDMLLVGVTVLTSMSSCSFEAIGFGEQYVPRLVRVMAEEAQDSGLDGVVCSALEAPLIREDNAKDFIIVTPGIRYKRSNDDQVRIATPKEAIDAGSDYLVIGREITLSDDPAKTIMEIVKSIGD